jgi:cation diffusion facilitator family transporter
MTDGYASAHDHVFLGAGHERNERRTWSVIALCTAMMVAEIVGGLLFGSIALVADGLHMSTHASALLLAALAYRYARRYSRDPRFTFGTGKLGDLAGYTSAIVLAMIAVLIAYASVERLIVPVPISFSEAILIAVLGLAVNIASVALLGGHRHGHDHQHGHAHDHDEGHVIETRRGNLTLEIFEADTPPRFRLRAETGEAHDLGNMAIETVRPDGARHRFVFADRGSYLESVEVIPEPHEFTAIVTFDNRAEEHCVAFEEHDGEHARAHRDNNMRAAVVHVLADAAVSVLVIVGLVLARLFGWIWMDPLVGLCGSFVTAAWAYGLVRDTGAILLDMNPDRQMARRVQTAIEAGGDRVVDLHLWRLGPGHLGAILSIATKTPRGPDHYRRLLEQFRMLSHLTIEVQAAARSEGS